MMLPGPTTPEVLAEAAGSPISGTASVQSAAVKERKRIFCVNPDGVAVGFAYFQFNVRSAANGALLSGATYEIRSQLGFMHSNGSVDAVGESANGIELSAQTAYSIRVLHPEYIGQEFCFRMGQV